MSLDLKLVECEASTSRRMIDINKIMGRKTGLNSRNQSKLQKNTNTDSKNTSISRKCYGSKRKSSQSCNKNL